MVFNFGMLRPEKLPMMLAAPDTEVSAGKEMLPVRAVLFCTLNAPVSVV